MHSVVAESSVKSALGGVEEVAAAPATKTAVKTTETCVRPPTNAEKNRNPKPPPPPSSRHARLIVLAGPCGSGKTTVGRALSGLLGSPSTAASAVPFLDADDYHDAKAKNKMSRGEPLDDGDRLPWLRRVAMASRDAAAFSPSHVAVLACSALKKKYRDLLVEVANPSEAAVPTVAVDFVLLRAKKENLRARHERRQEKLLKSSGALEEVAGHFLHPSLLESQLEAWEDSEEVVQVENEEDVSGGEADAGASARRVAEAVLLAVGLGGKR